MIIACGVLSCVAVLVGIIILEIAIDRKNKRKQASQASPDEKPAEELAKAEEQQASPDEKLAEEPTKAEEQQASQTSSDEKPAEEPVKADETYADDIAQTEELVKVEPILEDGPAEVVVPKGEPIIEEAPSPVEELVHFENIIAEEPAVVVNRESAVEPVVAEQIIVQPEPVVAEQPIANEQQVVIDQLAIEPVVTEQPVVVEPPIVEQPAIEGPVVEPPVSVEEPAEVIVAEEQIVQIEEPVSELAIEAPVVAEESAKAEEQIVAEEPAPEVVAEVAEPAVVEEAPAEAAEPEVEEPAAVAEPETVVEEKPEEEIKDTVSDEEVADANEPDDEPEAEEDDLAELNEAEDLEPEEVASELKVVVKDGTTRYIVIKYSKSFEAKLIQGTDDAKRYYSELKNYLCSFGVKSNLVKSRMSWKWESFRYGRKTLARLRLRGKTLSVVLALNPDDYKDTKYLVESLADVQCYADTPALYRIKSERRLKYTKELIAKMMQDNGLSQKENYETVDYAPLYPYDTTENLIERKLIKVLTDDDAQSGEVFMPSDIRKSVKAQDVDNILQDDIAVELIEKLDGVSDRTKSGIINIDTLSQNFKDGETVTIEEIRKRIKGYNKVTYIKVLARGTLDKRLTVEADDFSLQAVKMIALLGGRVVKK